jgi:zinc-finger-containing domain
MARTIPCLDCHRMFGDPDALAQHRRGTHDNPAWVASTGPGQKHKTAPICPKCGEPATVTATQYRPWAQCCGLHSWDLKPLVDPDTHKARNAAHAAFDPLWQRRTLSRGEAYRRLQIATGLSSADCHISLMSEAQALRVVEIVRLGLLEQLTCA